MSIHGCCSLEWFVVVVPIPPFLFRLWNNGEGNLIALISAKIFNVHVNAERKKYVQLKKKIWLSTYTVCILCWWQNRLWPLMFSHCNKNSDTMKDDTQNSCKAAHCTSVTYCNASLHVGHGAWSWEAHQPKFLQLGCTGRKWGFGVFPSSS